MAHSKKEYQQWFGVSNGGTLRHRLVKIVMFNLIQKLELDICPTCGKKIEKAEDLSVGHIKPWRKCYSREGNKELFWDLNNICFQHVRCNTIDDKTYQTNSEIQIIDEMKELQHRERANIWASEVLGGCYNTMNRHLFTNILFDLAKKTNTHICHRCNNPIESARELSLDHIVNWRWAEDKDKPELFYDANNVAFSHRTCNYAAKTHMNKTSKYIGVCYNVDKKIQNPKKVWRVELRSKDKKHFLGRYELEEEAAEARDMGVIKYNHGIGELNFPEKIEEYKQKIEEGWPETRKSKCKICGGKHFCKGLCSKHYYQDPEVKEYYRKRNEEKKNSANK